MSDTVSVREGIEYGFSLLAYVLAVGVTGGIVVLIGSVFIGSGGQLLGGLIVIGGIVVIYAGFLGIAYKVIADGVKVGIEASKDGGSRSESQDSNNRQVLYSNEDIETVEPETFTYYDFQIQEYGYSKGKLSLYVETVTLGTVDVLVTTQQDRERADSVENLSPIDTLSRYGVQNEKIEGTVNAGEWSIVIRNSGTESVDVESAYRIEAIPHS